MATVLIGSVVGHISGQRRITYYQEAETTEMAQNLLKERLRNFDGSACATFFRRKRWQIGGKPFTGAAMEISKTAETLKFYDCREQGPYGGFTLDQIIHNGEHTLARVHWLGESARRIWKGPKGARTSAILLWDDFFGGVEVDVGDQQNIVLHEVVHVISEWSDEEIFGQFSADGLRHPDGSHAFTKWLRSNCEN